MSDKKTILLVEDDFAITKALSDRFAKDDFNLIKANNGELGLKVALENHPDLILLDIIMPEMDGMTMLSKLREDEWGKTADVIILTNLDTASKVEEAAERGVYDFLVKTNWKLDDLVSLVKKRLQS